MKNSFKHPASFRDPDAFIFQKNNKFYRQVNTSYRRNYDELMVSGLYQKLSEANLLIPHKEIDEVNAFDPEQCYKVLSYDSLPFISYPYEWCFSQLKEAALATLTIQEEALRHNMSLKDASAYNIQWHQGAMKLIDTGSFETYEEGKSWVAYHQFCQHFLAPLALMHYTDIRLNTMLRSYIDGIPLDLVIKLLPFSARFRLGSAIHLFLHAKMIKRYENITNKKTTARSVSKTNMIAMCDSLKSCIKALRPYKQSTEWEDYYNNTNYEDNARHHKHEVVAGFIKTISPKKVWDLGANTGEYSRLAISDDSFVLACDIDPSAVEKNYQQSHKEKTTQLLPLLMNLTNPSPALGWFHQERDSLCSRGPVDLVMALALVHHLAISNNLPLENIAEFFHGIAEHLIIEFVPKSDSQVQGLLAIRKDIFPNYIQEYFEKVFSIYFTILAKVKIDNTERTCYFMKTKS